jgi:hypothetical protein
MPVRWRHFLSLYLRSLSYDLRCDCPDAASLPLAKYYRSRLLYRDWVFHEGDEVYVMNYTASSEYAAVICGITPTEVVVLSEKGKYCRLVIMDLRQGRVVLSTLDGSLARDDESFASS